MPQKFVKNVEIRSANEMQGCSEPEIALCTFVPAPRDDRPNIFLFE
jgi:hypothetical protein